MCMLMTSQRRELGLAEETVAAEAAGIRSVGLPTPDRGNPDLQPFRALAAELAGELASGHQVGRPLSVGHRPVVAGRCPRAGDQAMPITGCLGRDKRCARTSRCRALPNSDAGPTPPCSSANHRQSRPQRPERPDMDALITLEFQSDPALIDGY